MLHCFFLIALLLRNTSLDFFQSFRIHLCNPIFSEFGSFSICFVSVNLSLTSCLLLSSLEMLDLIHFLLMRFTNLFHVTLLFIMSCFKHFFQLLLLLVFFNSAAELITNFPSCTTLLILCGPRGLNVGMGDKLVEVHLIHEEIETHHVA